MKHFLTITALVFCTFTVTAATQTPHVKDLKSKEDGSYLVQCTNETKGTISQEEDNICVFSEENNKNRCDNQNNWSVDDAAEYMCK